MATINIGSIAELIVFGERVDKGSSSSYLDVELISDLDFEGYQESLYSWNGCTGTWYVHFNGNGHTIKNIYYNDVDNWGFFQSIESGSTIKNLNLTELYVNSQASVGGIACYAIGSTIENCAVSGQIEGNSSNDPLGGIIGDARTSISVVRECSFSGKIINHGSGDIAGIGGAHPTAQAAQTMRIFNSIVVADLKSDGRTYGLTGDANIVVNSEVRGTLKGSSVAVLNGQADAISCIVAVTDVQGSYIVSGSKLNCYMDNTLIASIPSNLTGASTSDLQSLSWLYDHDFAI